MKNGQTASFQRLPATKSMEMLDVHLTPTGDHSAQIAKMRVIAELWAARIQVGHLKGGEVWAALKTTISKKLEYALPALHLTPQECTFILTLIVKIGLPKAGVPVSIHSTPAWISLTFWLQDHQLVLMAMLLLGPAHDGSPLE